MYKRIGEFAAVAAPVRDPMIPARVFTAPPAVVPDRVVRPARWERRYEVSVLCCDLLCLALANLIVAVGYRPTTALADGQRIAVIVVCTVVTVLSMAFQKGWDRRILGSGPEEYRRIVRAYLYAVASSAILAFSLGADRARAYIFVALPLALMLTLAARKVLRIMVLHARTQGRCLRSVLVVGNAEEVHELVSRTNGAGESGWKVEGVCLADARGKTLFPFPADHPWRSTTFRCWEPTPTLSGSPRYTGSMRSRCSRPTGAPARECASSTRSSRTPASTSSSPRSSSTSSARACTSRLSRGSLSCR